MSVAAVVVAAGQGVRFGGPKQFAAPRSTTPSPRTACARRGPWPQRVVLVVPANYDGNGEGADVVVIGRQRLAPPRCAPVSPTVATPTSWSSTTPRDRWRSPALFAAVVDAVTNGADGAIPGLAISDTVKRVSSTGDVTVVAETVPRDELVTVQTPQAFRREVLVRAHASAATTRPTTPRSSKRSVGGSSSSRARLDNVKITEPGDLVEPRASIGCAHEDRSRYRRAPARATTRHARTLVGSRRRFPTRRASSVTPTPTSRRTRSVTRCSARANLGDLGRHFPDTDPAFAGASSRQLLVDTVALVRGAGLRVESADITIIAERPKLAPFMAAMSDELSAVVGALVTVKATTAEGLGALGRVEGIAATRGRSAWRRPREPRVRHLEEGPPGRSSRQGGRPMTGGQVGGPRRAPNAREKEGLGGEQVEGRHAVLELLKARRRTGSEDLRRRRPGRIGDPRRHRVRGAAPTGAGAGRVHDAPRPRGTHRGSPGRHGDRCTTRNGRSRRSLDASPSLPARL